MLEGAKKAGTEARNAAISSVGRGGGVAALGSVTSSGAVSVTSSGAVPVTSSGAVSGAVGVSGKGLLSQLGSGENALLTCEGTRDHRGYALDN